MLDDTWKNFAVDHHSITPIYQQLAAWLEGIADAHADTVRLPSERELAEALGVSRQSVSWAINDLVERGRAVRNGRKGTFTCPPAAGGSGLEAAEAESSEEGPAGLHPLSLYHFASGGRKPAVSLLLFENYPDQKEFWETTVRRFNRTSTDCEAVISWASANDWSQQAYCEYAERGGFDLIQGHTFLINRDLLRPLPDDLRESVYDPQEGWGHCFRSMPGELKRVLFPVYFVFWELYGRRSLWERYLGDGMARSGENDLFARLPEWRSRIPESCFLTESACTLISSCGFYDGYGYEELAGYCRKLEELSRLPRVFLPFTGAWNTTRRFREGRQLLFPALSNYMRIVHPAGMDDVFRTLLWPEAGREAVTASGVLGIGRCGRNPEGAEAFLRFLLADEIQEAIFSRMNVLPLRRSVLPGFRRAFPQYSQKECERFILLHNAFRCDSPAQRLSDMLYRDLQRLAIGEASAEAVLETAERRNLFPKAMSRIVNL